MKKVIIFAIAALTVSLGAFGAKAYADKQANSCCVQGAACCVQGAACCE